MACTQPREHSIHKENNAAPVKRKRPSVDVAWTAKRCQRLLRSITSRLALLRRLHRLAADVHKPVPGSLTAASLGAGLTEPSSPLPSPPESPASPSEFPDSPDWLPGRGSRLGTTYARTRRRPRPKAPDQRPKHDAVAFPTPLVKKLLNPGIHSPFQPADSPLHARPKPAPGRSAKRSLHLPLLPADSTEEAHRNLVVAFETFLNNTMGDRDTGRCGASSLLDMSLRKVAHYVELEEYSKAPFEKDDHDPCDATSEMYAELEDIGTRSGGGWQGLRLVIQAHCARHLERAIEDGVLPVTIIRQLLDTCARYDAVREAQGFIEAYLRSDSATQQALDFLLDLESYCLYQRAEAFWLRNLSLLLATNQARLEHFTRRNTLWRLLIRLSTTGDSADVEQFLFAYAACLVHTGSQMAVTAAARRLQEVLAVLSAMSLSMDTAANPTLASHIATMLHRVTLALVPASQMTSGHRARMPLLNASLLLRCCIRERQDLDWSGLHLDFLVDLVSGSAATSKPHKGSKAGKATASFACAVVTIANRIHDGSGTVLMRRIILAISKAADTAGRNATRRYLRSLALDCTLSYSGTCEDEQCVQAARGVGVSTDSDKAYDSHDMQLPENTEAFRWEEGLCEWVQATPARQHTMEAAIKHGFSPMDIRTERNASGSRRCKSVQTGYLASEMGKPRQTIPRRHAFGAIQPKVIRITPSQSMPMEHRQPYCPGKENRIMFEAGLRRCEGRVSCCADASEAAGHDDDDELALISPVKRRQMLDAGRLDHDLDQRKTSQRAKHMLDEASNDSDDELGM